VILLIDIFKNIGQNFPNVYMRSTAVFLLIVPNSR